MQVFLILAIAIAIVAVIFAIQNLTPVAISFLLWKTDSISLALVLLIAVGAGLLIGLFASMPGNLKAQWNLSQQKKRIGDLEKSLDEQRAKAGALESSVQDYKGKIESAEQRLKSGGSATAK